MTGSLGMQRRSLKPSEAAEAQHSAEEQRLSQEREQLEAQSAQVSKLIRYVQLLLEPDCGYT